MLRIPVALLALAGCGRVGFDTQGDAMTDAADAFVCSPVGHDEDGDGVDDACDACPQLVDDQRDADADGVGDACDPHDGVKDTRVAFDPFLTMSSTWTDLQQADFMIDHVVFAGVNDSIGMTLVGTPDGTYEIGGVLTQIGTSPTRGKQVALEAHVTNAAGSYYCEIYNDPMADVISFKLTYTEDDISHSGLAQMNVPGNLAPLDFRVRLDTQDLLTTCVFDYGAMHIALPAAQVPNTLPFGELRVAVNDVDADIRYYVHLTE